MPDKIGKFEVIELLGRGAMGVVYKGHDPSLARHVAIKVMTAHLEMDPELRARFFREAQSAGSLQHPNIITIFELGESDGQPYIAMEYVPGRDLDDIIAAREPLTIVEKVDLIEQVCRGLSFAHERRIIHRDIKPANIRVTEMGQVKVMDFGVAHLVTSDLTQTGSLVGTPYYMAPEVVNAEPVDARADIFSMGATFYELLSYSRPFQGDNLQTVFRKILHEDPAPLRDLGFDVPPIVQQVLDRSLAKRPRDRYADTGDFLADLMQFWETLPAPAQARAAATTALGRAASKAARAARRRWGWKRLIPLAAGAAIGVAGLLIVAGAFFGTAFFRPTEPASGAARPEQFATSETAAAAPAAGVDDPGAAEAREAQEPAGAGATDRSVGVAAADNETADAATGSESEAASQPPAVERQPAATPPPATRPDPTARERVAYQSARSSAVSERGRAVEAGAGELAVPAFAEGESLLSRGDRAAARGRYSEAESDMRRAETAFAYATRAAVALWSARLDSVRAAIAPLRAEADRSSPDYTTAERLVGEAKTAEIEARYSEALTKLDGAVDAYRAAAPPPVEEPAPAVTPPAEPTTEEIVQATLAELGRAIEGEDISALQRVWVGLGQDQLRGFNKFFDDWRDIKVAFEVESVQRSGERIEVTARTTYDYVNETTHRHGRQPFTQTLELAPRGGRWVIVDSRS